MTVVGGCSKGAVLNSPKAISAGPCQRMITLSDVKFNERKGMSGE
jgi:hypothetical protein